MFLSRLRRRRPWKKVEGADHSGGLVTVRDPASPSAEAYRALRTRLLYAFADSSSKVIMITSPGRGEGKTTTCTNLGVALSQGNNNTLVVDCDLRRPTVHKMFDLRNLNGLVNVAVGEYGLQEVCHEPLPQLKVLTAGPLPPNPGELLSSKPFAELIHQTRQQFEYVLIDVPPVQLVSDALIVARHGDGVVLAFNAQDTRKGSVRQSVRSLEAVGARVLGTVMNNVKVSTPDYYYHG